MNEGMVRSLGSGRFLDWGALDAQGAAGGILICWDKRTLEILEMEMVNSQFLADLGMLRMGRPGFLRVCMGRFPKKTGTPSGGSLGRLGESGMILGVLGVILTSL
ncbi:hypothetical protein CK203_080718 [Vitis vinifera]|uniref:Uncharacterized protein n=1 Tax=Vitis vinifera TaxID=29760 RepID=A0A438DZ70_VITVI|nr:hypothetical protein CK203_080718 [Vitis vinifera]